MSKEETKLSFEENIRNLEKIVKELESGSVDLDEAINKYTEAMSIVKLCSDKLNAAEEQINKIMNPDGSQSEFKVEE